MTCREQEWKQKSKIGISVVQERGHGHLNLGRTGYGEGNGIPSLSLPFHFSLSYIGEGNGNPLQCSCLENTRNAEPGGLLSMGSHRVGHNWSDLAPAAAAAAVHVIMRRKFSFILVVKETEFADGFDARCLVLGFPSRSDGKESGCNEGKASSIPGWGRSPGEKKWQPTPVFLPGKSHEWMSLVVSSP